MIPNSSSFADRLVRWYENNHRLLPWRPPRGKRKFDPYKVLVSEFMLQQTQVATVIPYFRRFLEKFPSVRHLAQADEQTVLRLWQGLGYYSRARNLHRTAKMVVAEFGGTVPSDSDSLLSLPGVGRYTAGAIASIAFAQRVPSLDGNVVRVLCRLDKITADPRAPQTLKILWKRAAEILPQKKIAEFNSALMELGATVCTPKWPACLLCPVRDFCEAQAAGLQEQIPRPKKAKATPLHHRFTLCIRSGNHWLIEQRPSTGRWASLWQFITFPAADRKPTEKNLTRMLGLPLSNLQSLPQVKHALTHRRYVFDVYSAETTAKKLKDISSQRCWVTLPELESYPLSRPQLQIANMLRSADD